MHLCCIWPVNRMTHPLSGWIVKEHYAHQHLCLPTSVSLSNTERLVWTIMKLLSSSMRSGQGVKDSGPAGKSAVSAQIIPFFSLITFRGKKRWRPNEYWLWCASLGPISLASTTRHCFSTYPLSGNKRDQWRVGTLLKTGPQSVWHAS